MCILFSNSIFYGDFIAVYMFLSLKVLKTRSTQIHVNAMRPKCFNNLLGFLLLRGEYHAMSMLMETGKLLINLTGTVMVFFTGLNNWTKQNQFTRHVSCNSPRLVIIITHDCKLYCLPPALSFGGQASVLRLRSSHPEVCKSRNQSSSLHCQTSGSNDHNNV